MNKIGMVLGVVAVATLAGCRDAEYDRKHGTSQNEVKSVPAETKPAATPAKEDKAPEVKPIVTTVRKCTCAPGTKHTQPCACGADDCMCVVVAKPVEPPAPETVTYVVQSGDYLAKISKRHNISIAAIKRLNPKIKGDNIWVGQKLKLPAGTVVEEPQALVTPATAKKQTVKKTVSATAKPYTGATKEYVVKNGDTLGAIAYSNGCNIRQLKQLNNLTADALKIGQKLKVPADGKAAAAKKTTAAAKPAETKPAEEKTAEPETTAAPAAPVAPADASTEPAAPVAPAPAPEAGADTAAPAPAPAAPATTDYVVQDGDDLVQVSLSFGVSVSVIRQLNNLGPTDQIKPGQVIKLPAEAKQQ